MEWFDEWLEKTFPESQIKSSDVILTRYSGIHLKSTLGTKKKKKRVLTLSISRKQSENSRY